MAAVRRSVIMLQEVISKSKRTHTHTQNDRERENGEAKQKHRLLSLLTFIPFQIMPSRFRR